MEESRTIQRKDSLKMPSDYEIIITLADTQASAPNILFPLGCRVCFDHSASTTSKYVTEATEGIVSSVSMGRDPSKPMSTTMTIIYTVEVMDDEGVKRTEQHFQEDLAYAYGCPVYLVVDDDRKVEAEIAMSQRVVIDTSRGEVNLMYVVVSRDEKGGRVRTEKGVKPSRVRYRKIETGKAQKNQIQPEAHDNVASLEGDRGPSSEVINKVTDLTVPSEIVSNSNQMDSFSEALTDFPEVTFSSAKNNDIHPDASQTGDEVSKVAVKEEIIADEVAVGPVVNSEEIFEVDGPKVKPSDTAASIQGQLPSDANLAKPSDNAASIQGQLPSGRNPICHRVSVLSKDANTADMEVSRGQEKTSIERTSKCIEDKKEANAKSNISQRWKPPKQQSNNAAVSNESLNGSALKMDGTTKHSRQNRMKYKCKIVVPEWLCSTAEERDALFLHILGVWPNGKKGRKVSHISKETNCNVSVDINCDPLEILIHTKDVPVNDSGIQRAEELIKNSLFEFVKSPSGEMRLVRDLATSTTRNYLHDTAETPRVEPLKTSGSDSISGTTHARDENSLSNRPKKLLKKATNETPSFKELSVPLWVTNGSKSLFFHLIGEGGCKQKEMKAATGCNLSISPCHSETREMKIRISIENSPANNHLCLKAAKDQILDSITEFMHDESASIRMFCEMLKPMNSMDELCLCSNARAIEMIDPNSTSKALWVKVLDLPYSVQREQYHGNFLMNSNVIDEIQNHDCSLQVYGGEFGHELNFAGCEPFVLIYGTKKDNVIQAVKVAKRIMQSHQRRCGCEPSW